MDTSPFKFLEPYEKEDKEIFFGRNREIETLYQMTFQTNLILVYGMSGTGKTSLIQCGLANRFDSSDWYEVFIRRQENINKSLIRELKYKDEANSFEPNYSVTDMVRSLYLDYLKPIYLIFDQFEELFILGNEAEQDKFIESIKPLIGNPDLPARIIIVIREEYLAHLTRFEKEVPHLFEKRLRIEPMTRFNAIQVVENTTRAFDIDLRPSEVAGSIIDNITEGKGRIQLTYLQVFLDKLYRMAFAKSPDPIVFDTPLIEEVGQIDDVLGDFLDEQLLVFAREVDNKDSAVRFLKVFVSDKGTKIPIPQSEIEDLVSGMSIAKINIYINFFVNRRILKPLDNNQYEIAHDSLAEKIYRAKVKGIVMPNVLTPETPPDKPFPGFEPYAPNMAAHFHGRGLEVQDLFDKVINEQQVRTTLVFGPMGVGKSSLILAGLMPRLSNLAKVSYIKCSRTFLENANVQHLLNHPPDPKSQGSEILDLAYQWERDQPNESERKIIIFDQFEEFYIWIPDPEYLHNFYAHIQHLIQLKINTDIIFVVRDEFFSHLQDFEYQVPGILDEQVRVKNVTFDTAMRIVEKIAGQADLEFEDPSIIEKVVANICEEDGKVNLTYLQLYLERLVGDVTSES